MPKLTSRKTAKAKSAAAKSTRAKRKPASPKRATTPKRALPKSSATTRATAPHPLAAGAPPTDSFGSADFFELNRDFSRADLEKVLNDLELKLYPDPAKPGERLLGLSPAEDSTRAYVGPALRPPLANNLVVRDFARTLEETAAAAGIEKAESDPNAPLVCRSWGEAWVSGQLKWVALFDRVPKATPVVPTSLAHVIKNQLPWNRSRPGAGVFKGLAPNGLRLFGDGEVRAVSTITDADIDTDGPDGGKARDPWWLPNTSLRWPGGASCDSRTFRGVVIPPAFSRDYDVRPGDVAYVCLKDKCLAAQVYDVGPATKIGEISFGLAVDLGIYPDRQPATERRAATGGNSVKDLLTVFFPGSGGRHALPAEAVDEIAKDCLAALTAGHAPRPGGQTTPQPGTFAALLAQLGPLNFTADELLVNTTRGSNSAPPPRLWHNILPTLTVLQALRQELGPIQINSGYRNHSYNTSVGGAQRSQHMAFRALDFSASGHAPAKVAAAAMRLRGKQYFIPVPNLKLVEEGAPLDVAGLQLKPGQQGGVNGTYFTFHGGVAAYPSFVHIDCRGTDSDWG